MSQIEFPGLLRMCAGEMSNPNMKAMVSLMIHIKGGPSESSAHAWMNASKKISPLKLLVDLHSINQIS